MDKKKSNLLTANEFIYIIIGTMVGVGIFNLPNGVTKLARQDGWISVILGASYPLYVVLILSILIKNHSDENIVVLSKKYMGKFIGNILSFCFSGVFVIIGASVAAAMNNVIRVYAVPFMTPVKICIVATVVAAYAAYKGIKLLGRINTIVFYLTLFLLLLSASALRYGSFLNLRPVFGAGISKIMAGVKETVFAYMVTEILLIIYPYLKVKKDAAKAAIKAVVITTAFYTWAVFITIYYLGINIIPKNYWSFIMVSESVQIPIINNFRFIFLFLWIVVILKVISLHYYAAALILSEVFNIKRKAVCVLIFPVFVYIELQLANEVVRSDFMSMILPKLLAFDLIYITCVAALVIIRDRNAKRGRGKSVTISEDE